MAGARQPCVRVCVPLSVLTRLAPPPGGRPEDFASAEGEKHGRADNPSGRQRRRGRGACASLYLLLPQRGNAGLTTFRHTYLHALPFVDALSQLHRRVASFAPRDAHESSVARGKRIKRFCLIDAFIRDLYALRYNNSFSNMMALCPWGGGQSKFSNSMSMMAPSSTVWGGGKRCVNLCVRACERVCGINTGGRKRRRPTVVPYTQG